MRKLVSIKDIAGKTVAEDNGRLFYEDLVIHFTDGTSLMFRANAAACCNDAEAWIEEITIANIEEATDGQLSDLYTNDVITCEEWQVELKRRKAAKVSDAEKAERIQYEALKAKFERKDLP